MFAIDQEAAIPRYDVPLHILGCLCRNYACVENATLGNKA